MNPAIYSLQGLSSLDELLKRLGYYSTERRNILCAYTLLTSERVLYNLLPNNTFSVYDPQVDFELQVKNHLDVIAERIEVDPKVFRTMLEAVHDGAT